MSSFGNILLNLKASFYRKSLIERSREARLQIESTVSELLEINELIDSEKKQKESTWRSVISGLREEANLLEDDMQHIQDLVAETNININNETSNLDKEKLLNEKMLKKLSELMSIHQTIN